METLEIKVVQDWHEALNHGDIERLVALSAADVEVGGPRGTSRGAAVLRDWFARAGLRLEPKQVYQRAENVVVEQLAEWREPGTNRIVGQQVVATLFVVRDGQVARVVRYEDLDAALAAMEK